MFDVYLKLGIEHIADIRGYDHILFIVTLCGIYILKQWKNILVLITAFTIGHTLTLVLATYNIVAINSNLIEFLIPVTILFTSIFNIAFKSLDFTRNQYLIKYIFTLFFGLIHGLGFSYYLRDLLYNENSIVMPLFAFNVGIELGQLLIVLCVQLLAYLIYQVMHMERRDWNFIISGAGAGISLIMALERWPF